MADDAVVYDGKVHQPYRIADVGATNDPSEERMLLLELYVEDVDPEAMLPSGVARIQIRFQNKRQFASWVSELGDVFE